MLRYRPSEPYKRDRHIIHFILLGICVAIIVIGGFFIFLLTVWFFFPPRHPPHITRCPTQSAGAAAFFRIRE